MHFLNFIDLIIPLAIQFDFLCLCLFILHYFCTGKNVLIADVIVASTIASLASGSAFASSLSLLYI